MADSCTSCAGGASSPGKKDAAAEPGAEPNPVSHLGLGGKPHSKADELAAEPLP